MTARLADLNDALRQSANALRAHQPEVELCAIELADAVGAAERLQIVREGLADGAAPRELGLAFVVTVAELAYQVDWTDQFSFWPRLNDQLSCDSWNPAEASNSRACASSFQRFAEVYGGLRPSGRFATNYPHMSWPLFHAVLPRAAHRRMAWLLAKAAGDPRMKIAADGCPDEVSLGELLKAFALSMEFPAYFEGLLSHPTLMGRLASRLLRPASATPTNEGPSSWLYDRVLADLQQDSIANSALQHAKAESTRRVHTGSAQKLPVPAISLSLDLRDSCLTARVEVAALPPEARDSRALRAALEQADATLELDFGGQHVLCGPVRNLFYGPVDVAARWPNYEGAFSAGLRLVGASGTAEEYFARATVDVRPPKAFAAAPGGKSLALVDELALGQDVAVVVGRAQALKTDALAARLGLRQVALTGTETVVALVGKVSPDNAVDWARLSTALGLRTTEGRLDASPALVPPIRHGSLWAEWLEGVDAFVLLRGNHAGSLTAQFATGGDRLQLPVSPISGGAIVAVSASLGAGRLTLQADGSAVGGFDVRRRQRPHYRAPTHRFHAALAPRGATVGQLLGDACGLDVRALPGVRLRLGLQADDVTAREDLGEKKSPLATCEVLGRLWRKIGGEHVAAAQAVAISVEDLDAGLQGSERIDLTKSSGSVLFEANAQGAQASTRGEASLVKMERYGPDGGPPGGSGEPCASFSLTDTSTPGVYVALAENGEEASIAWAPSGTDGWSIAKLPDAAGSGVGFLAALETVTRLRQVESAAAGPPRHAGSALILRERTAQALRRRLVAALCGARWAVAESAWIEARQSVDDIARSAAPFLWVPRSWLAELGERTASGRDLLAVVETACREGVGDSLGLKDVEAARHIALLMSRTSLAAPEDDDRHLRWAAESLVRGRVVRILALALAASVDGGALSA